MQFAHFTRQSQTVDAKRCDQDGNLAAFFLNFAKRSIRLITSYSRVSFFLSITLLKFVSQKSHLGYSLKNKIVTHLDSNPRSHDRIELWEASKASD